MSLDYPNRADWLAKRSTWRNKHKYERLIWDSHRHGTYVRAKHGPIGQGARRVR
jgi:hypothetical protein